jgi:hypothetical protein
MIGGVRRRVPGVDEHRLPAVSGCFVDFLFKTGMSIGLDDSVLEHEENSLAASIPRGIRTLHAEYPRWPPPSALADQSFQMTTSAFSLKGVDSVAQPSRAGGLHTEERKPESCIAHQAIFATRRSARPLR